MLRPLMLALLGTSFTFLMTALGTATVFFFARKVCELSCIACGACERACPAGAIHVVDNHAVIDYSACIACGMCAIKCPRGVIRDAWGIVAQI